jgi:biopolymer transport protein ExbB/TolQ
MKRSLPTEFIYQIASLLIAVIFVHLFYITVVRPNADAILAAEAARSAAGEAFVQERSLYIVLRDYEQESCFILGLWSFAIMGYKIRTAIRERRLFDTPIINVSEGTSILPEDTREYARPIQALPDETRHYLLPRALLAALLRFASTRNVHDVAETVKSVCDGESERLDSELSMVRYIAWAIPAIGFVGTVRGIGEALGQAYRAVQGDIAGVTASLGTAFNSTFVALVISIILMFVLHQLQMIQDRLVQDSQTFCDQRLIRHMQVR